MKMGRERAVEDTDILPLKEENTTQGLRDPYYSWQFDHILSHSSTTAFSLRSKRFRVSSSRKLGREQKRGMRGSGRGEKEKLARKAHDFDSANFVWPWKIVSVSICYFVLSSHGWKDQNMDSSFSGERKLNRVAVWCRSEVSIDF